MDQWIIAVLGDGGVGKTALATQFAMNCFVEAYGPAIEQSFRKQLIVDDRMSFVEVIDTAGQEEYATLRDVWVREAQGYILMYSIASRSTFDRLGVFHQSIKRVRGLDSIFILVGNKCDKSWEREVTREEGAALAQQFGCDFFEASAKTAENVETLFVAVVRALRRQRTRRRAQNSQNPAKPSGKLRIGKTKCIIL